MAPPSLPPPPGMLPPLSFGVEFEFAFAYALPGRDIPRHHLDGSDGLPPPFRGHYQMKEPTYRPDVSTWPQLEVFNLINKALHDGGLKSFHGPIPDSEKTATTDQGRNIRWHIKGDPSIEAPEGPDEKTYHWIDCEVVSPVLIFPTDLWQVQRACDILNRFRISTNPSTGFHVHVGLPYPPGFVLNKFPSQPTNVPKFDFEHLQKIVAFFYIFGPKIDNLHPPNRENTMWARNMRIAVPMALEELERDVDTKSKWECLAAIMQCGTERELVYVAGHAEGSVSPVVSLADYIPGLYHRRTVEFRQHAGTTEWPRIEAWIRLTVGLTDYCRYVDQDEFADLVGGQADKEDNDKWKELMSTKQVLELTNDPVVVDFYENRLARWNWREPEAPGVGRPRTLSNEFVTDSDEEEGEETAKTAQGYARQVDEDVDMDDDDIPFYTDEDDEEDNDEELDELERAYLRSITPGWIVARYWRW